MAQARQQGDPWPLLNHKTHDRLIYDVLSSAKGPQTSFCSPLPVCDEEATEVLR